MLARTAGSRHRADHAGPCLRQEDQEPYRHDDPQASSTVAGSSSETAAPPRPPSPARRSARPSSEDNPSEASFDQLGRDVLPIAIAIADPPAMGTLLGQIAHHGLPLDAGGHECSGRVAAWLAGLAGVRDLWCCHTFEPHVDAGDDNRITVQHVRPPD